MHINSDQIVCPLRETGPTNLRNSEGAIIELRDGRLLLAYTHFYADADDFGAGDIRGKTSCDGGKTWSAPFVIEANHARTNVGRLSLCRLHKFHDSYHHHPAYLAHIYVEQNGFYTNRLVFKTSIDEGKTWAAPVQVNDTGTLGHICQRGDTALVLSTGRILVPVYAMFGGLCASFMYYSDDNGDHWQRSRGEISIRLKQAKLDIAYADFQEPAVVERRDGRLLCFGRTRLGQQYQSISDNGGVTWSRAEPSGLASSYSPASLKAIPTTGDILCVWNQVSGQEIADGLARMRMSCAISKDEGQTWTHFKNLESLDDCRQVEPEADAIDNAGELQAIWRRKALKISAPARADYPDAVKARYPRWGGYIHVDYPSVSFTRDGNVLIMYGVYSSGGDKLPLGQRLVIRPIEWFYDK